MSNFLNKVDKVLTGFFAILFIILFVAVAVTPVGLAFLILWGMCSKKKDEPKEKLQNNIYWSSCSNIIKRNKSKKITMFNDKGYKFEIVI
jgi:hypothetical protein